MPTSHDHRSAWWTRIRHAVGHSHGHLHDHDHTATKDLGAEGIRATKVSLLALGATAVVQALLVAVTGSVALLSDTIHNFTDALTAIPLWIAFSLGRRPHTKRFTYGYHRAEDLAGLIIVVAIGFSAVAVAWESAQRIREPQQLEFVPWVIAAGLIGAAGNEWVARYRTRVGQRINSAALVADGQHARADALTSLAVVAAGIGAAANWDWVDPVAGLLVAVIILRLLGQTARSMFGRLLDAVDPEIVDRIKTIALETAGVKDVASIRARHHGHRLLITMSVSVDPDTTVAAGHEVAHAVEHNLLHEFPAAADPVVHVDPHGDTDAHDSIAHHHDGE